MSLLNIRSGQSRLLDGIYNASIGPVTSDTLTENGLRVDVQAAQYTIPGLVEAISDLAKAKGNGTR